MKKIIVLLLLSTLAFSCKNGEEKTREPETETATTEKIDSFKAYQGDFINSEGALVLMGSNFIYGVKRNELSEELSKQVAAVKINDYDMVNVIVRGTVSKNTDNTSEWEEVITIKEIVRVSDAPSKIDIKINETSK